LANRQANPITVGTNAYEKWVRLKVTATPANYVQSFKVWFNETVDTSTTLDFTGAFVTWNQQGHSNPWAWDRERNRGSLKILKGKSSASTIRAFCDENAVEFALLPVDDTAALAPLQATGEFEQRAEIPGYVLLERVQQ
jgi:hypothetical protein